MLVLSNLIKFVDVNSHNWSFKNGTFLALKNIAKKLTIFLEKSYFWQYLPNLALPGNPGERLKIYCCVIVTQ